METEIIRLFENKPQVTLTTYTRPGNHPAIIVLPGGAYTHFGEYEGEPVALKFMSCGFNAFVLHYSVGDKARFPGLLQEISASVVHVRKNAEKYGIDPSRVFVTGSSAGGHLAGMLATMWHLDCAKCCPDMEYAMNRPDGIILSYACVTTEPDYNLDCITDVRGDMTVEDLSVEKHVTDKTCPAFIWHSSKDTAVHPVHALRLAEAYAKAGIDFELRIYNDGGHGTSLGTYGALEGYAGKNELKSAAWADDAARWALEKGQK